LKNTLPGLSKACCSPSSWGGMYWSQLRDPGVENAVLSETGRDCARDREK